MCFLPRSAFVNIENELDIHTMENRELARNVASTIAGDGGEAVAATGENLISESPGFLLKPADAGWYVAVVRVNCEKRIADDIQGVLGQKGVWFEYWVPRVKVTVLDKRTKKRKEVDRVFLSTFIFCHISLRNINEVRFLSDVYKMLSMPGCREIYRIPDAEMENYRRFVDRSCMPVSAYTGPLRKGQKMRIIGGMMEGVEAYVQHAKGNKAVIGCEIKYISGATIEISRDLLEPVG